MEKYEVKITDEVGREVLMICDIGYQKGKGQ